MNVQYGRVKSYVADLPMEIHSHIRNKLMTDSETTVSQLRPLRLVCRLFNIIWSPVVLADLVLFAGDPTSQVDRLVDIASDKGTTAGFTTLTLRHWDLLEFSWSLVKHRQPLYENGYLRLLLFPVNFLLATPVVLVLLLMHARTIPQDFKGLYNSIRTRRYITLLPGKLRLPHLRCIRLFLPNQDDYWTAYHLTRMLSMFPHVTELELNISREVDIPSAFQCLRAFQGLRQLTLVIRHLQQRRKKMPYPDILGLSRFIANNPDITHLTIRTDTRELVDLSNLFLHVPLHRPLKLEHFSCNDNCQNFEALLPYIYSLSSFEFWCNNSGGNTWCTTLSNAEIYPPEIRADLLDQQILVYLKKHPGIVTLSFYTLDTTSLDKIKAALCDELCCILTQHSESLRYLTITSYILHLMFRTLQNKMNFKRCINLREIVLEGKRGKFHTNLAEKSYFEKQVLPVLAHVNGSLTVVLRNVQVEIFDACVGFCRQSDDPFVHNLAERLLLEP